MDEKEERELEVDIKALLAHMPKSFVSGSPQIAKAVARRMANIANEAIRATKEIEEKDDG